ncbi:MAG: hypothetical protein LC122_07365, partial [Chitinophagales bacterium]|nr:hypothetical protein [Chitinophagales bacterium]
MQTQDQSLIRDNLRLCQQILSKCNSKTVKYNTYYLTQEQKYKSSDGFYYQEPQTPYVLQKKQLIKILPKTQLISADDINDENDDLIYKSF